MGYPDPNVSNNGIFRKVVSQIDQWQTFGHEVKWFAISEIAQSNHSHKIIERNIATHQIACKKNRINRFVKAPEIINAVKFYSPDIVYSRFGSYYFGMGSLMNAFPTILEVNTDDLNEYKLMLPKFQYYFHLVTRKWSLSRSRGIVATTHSIANGLKEFNKPIKIIANSVSLKDYPITKAPNNQCPKLIFIGTNNAPWNGIDKILNLARIFHQWHFDIVGDIQASDTSLSLPNVIFHGTLSKNDYENFMINADVAIGTLALHRKGMDEACALKTREYLAYGLPIILAYQDTDFFNGAPFLLKLPNRDNNIEQNTNNIENFVSAWKGNRVDRGVIMHLDVESKEIQRVEFFNNVIAK